MTEIVATTPPANIGFTASNGPLIVTGAVQVNTGAAELESKPRASLCRCGASANKPFCDGSHRASGWIDAGDAVPAIELGEPGAPGPIVFTPTPDGPLLADGPLELQNSQKQTIANTVKTALCRCGASSNKPYCDGSHVAAGFKS